MEELLKVFEKKYYDEFDCAELRKCIYDHNCTIKLRNVILQLVALKLLYSDNTTPKRGYERAKRFINEFNENFDLNLSTNEIDELITRSYSNEKNLLKT